MSSTRDRISELQELQAQRQRELDEQREKVDALKRASQSRVSARATAVSAGAAGDRRSYRDVLNGLLPGRFDSAAASAPTLHRPSTLDVAKKSAEVNILPIAVSEAYEKGCQTSVSSASGGGEDADADAGLWIGGGQAESQAALAEAPPRLTQSAAERRMSTDNLPAKQEGVQGPEDAKTKAAAKAEIGEKSLPQPMSEEDSQKLMKTSEFLSFFDKSSKMVEKLLNAPATENLFGRDYGEGFADGDGEDLGMTEVADFESERWTRDRTVTDLQWSGFYPELFCASYGQKQNATVTDDEGVVCVWNLALTNRPEFVFTASSQVLAVRFDKFNPAVYLGSTYSGSIVLWDSRTNTRSPVQRTALISGRGHSHPVYALEQIGARGGELISVSTDGKLCVWNLAMLVHPQECVELRRGSRDVTVNSMAFGSESSGIWVGGEDGSVCQVQIHQNKTGVVDSLEGHQGLVSNVAANGALPGNDLLLTCSFDWSVHLYAPKKFQAPILRLQHYEDYVTDAKWHPEHPAVFATVDAAGAAEVWNLNESTESSWIAAPGPAARSGAKSQAFYKSCWDKKSGQRFCAGNTDGVVKMWQLEKKLHLGGEALGEAVKALEEKIAGLEPVDAGGDGGGGAMAGTRI